MWHAFGRLMPVLAADDEVDAVVVRGATERPSRRGSRPSSAFPSRPSPWSRGSPSAGARWILLTGELLSADVALRIGLVHEVVADDAVADRAHAVAATLASRAQVSLRGGKQMIDRAVAAHTDEDDEVLAIYQQSWTSAEYAEGVAAFREKRPPDFHAAHARHQT